MGQGIIMSVDRDMPVTPSAPALATQVRMGQRAVARHATQLLRHAILSVVGVFFVLPLFWMLSTALKTDRSMGTTSAR